MNSPLQKLTHELDKLGLTLLGGFDVRDKGLVAEKTQGSLLLIGNAGPNLWPRLQADLDRHQPEPGPHPLDRWTKYWLLPLAERLSYEIYFPFGGPPFHPFPTWAAATGLYHASPLGLMVHPEYGLWSAFRAALYTPEILDLSSFAPAKKDSPCHPCQDKPCLSACPVNAFVPGHYDTGKCKDHLRGPGQDCLENGCLARRACPLGQSYHYDSPQALHHMRAFRGDVIGSPEKRQS